jgi:uncharacterized protein YcfJ
MAARQVMQVQTGNDIGSNLLKAIPGAAGAALGGMAGGPMGSAVGGQLGGALGSGMVNSQVSPSIEGSTQPSAVDRRMQTLQNDPVTTMKEGRDSLKGYDTKTREALEPVLD